MANKNSVFRIPAELETQFRRKYPEMIAGFSESGEPIIIHRGLKYRLSEALSEKSEIPKITGDRKALAVASKKERMW